MSDEPRRPLRPLAPEERRRVLMDLGLDEDLLPLSLTPEERKAALQPEKPIPLTAEERRKALESGYYNQQRPKMEPKSGFFTSEFVLKLLAGLAIAAIAFTIDHGLPAIAAQLPNLGVVGTVLLVLVPVAKAALGWALQYLSSKYSDNRTELKVATLAAAGDGTAKA